MNKKTNKQTRKQAYTRVTFFFLSVAKSILG